MIEVRLPMVLAGFFDATLSSGRSCDFRHNTPFTDLKRCMKKMLADACSQPETICLTGRMASCDMRALQQQ